MARDEQSGGAHGRPATARGSDIRGYTAADRDAAEAGDGRGGGGPDARELILSLFPGIGLLDRAFEAEGYCVVRGPDLLWGGDVRRFHPPPGVFAGVIGGPPCKTFSRARGGSEATQGNLIPEFERVVSEAAPAWFLMENVPEAPLPEVEGYVTRDVLFRDHWVGGVTMRRRRFSFGTPGGLPLRIETLALHRPDPEPAACTSIWKDGRQYGARTRKDYEHALRKQGLPPDFELPGFKVSEAVVAVVNGVPLPMGRAVAQAVRRANQKARGHPGHQHDAPPMRAAG